MSEMSNVEREEQGRSAKDALSHLSPAALAAIDEWAMADQECKQVTQEWNAVVREFANWGHTAPYAVERKAAEYRNKLQDLDRTENRLRIAMLEAIAECYEGKLEE